MGVGHLTCSAQSAHTFAVSKWYPNQAPLPAGCVTVGKLPTLAEPRALCLEDGNNKNLFFYLLVYLSTS